MHRRRLLAAASAAILTGCGRSRPAVQLFVQSDGDFLEFKPDSLTAPAGAQVTLTFHHTGTIISQRHDWVLARPGTMSAIMAEVDAAAAKAGGDEDKSFLKADDPRIIAATPLIAKGQTTTITFTAPAPGDYPFFCSTPGHGESMHGILHVTPR